MLNGTIKGRCPFVQAGSRQPRAPVLCRRLEDGDDCHYCADESDEGGGAQPGGHGRSRVHLACRAGGPGLGDLKCLGHCGQVDDGNRYSQAEMLADHDHGQDRYNDLPGKQRPPVPQHPLPPRGFDLVSWHVVLVHAMCAVWVRVGVWACSSMTATRRSKTGSASVSTCRSCESMAAMADCSSAAFVA